MDNNAFPQLHKQQFINLTTYRKSGQPVVTTVWFAQVGDKLYGMSEPQAGKCKRIRNNPNVSVAPSTYAGKVLGEAATGLARMLPPAEASVAARALDKKYGLQMTFFKIYLKVRRTPQTFWEISPAREQTT
jgi:PPOX class probable F420-dependent enzyme